jgi:hypothetical protein
MTARALLPIAALALLAACSGTEPGERFFTSMNGANEIPPNGGTFTASSFIGISMDSALVLMRVGKAYVNVATNSLPNGEIRGQVVPN